MKLGIMQPYFFPYIGYWQLMNAVDKYVIYDDVNFIKGANHSYEDKEKILAKQIYNCCFFNSYFNFFNCKK